MSEVTVAERSSLGPLQLELAEEARRFCRTVIAPVVEDAEANEYTPRHILREAGRQGLIGVQYPTWLGGRDAGLLGAAIVREQTSYVNAGISSTLGHHDHVGTKYLVAQADEAQRQRWLVPAMAGDLLTSWAVTEPDAGSDVRSMRTRAVDASGQWRIQGAKVFITNGPSADIVQVVCRVGEVGDRFGVFVVERDRPGFESRRLLKMGLRPSQVGELRFDDVLVPDENRLSPTGGVDLAEILGVLAVGRVLVAASATGIAQAAFDIALGLRRSSHATATSPDVARAAFAEADTLIETMRLMTYGAARRCDATNSSVPVLACSRAKLFASEAALRVVSLLEAAIASPAMPLERHVRDVRFVQIVEGTTEIQHRIIAKQLGL